MNRPVQAFEHSTLPVGGQFTQEHFKCLVRYNERHGNRFFTIGSNRIHFRNYVGVIQAGDLTIEILPKADKAPATEDQKKKWQVALIDMLRQSGFIKVVSLTDARLRLRSSSLLDIYFESFLAEVHDLMHRGLVRKYRQFCGNLTALKGRILFQEHLPKNLVHRERFFTSHLRYDRNNPFNQILRAGLKVIKDISTNPHLSSLASSLFILFEGIDDVVVTEHSFDHLNYTRNTECYRSALQLARLIILNYMPDFRGGREDVLAILFDMNVLFERFVFAQLKRAEAAFSPCPIVFKAQIPKSFWIADGMRKTIRPDIIARIGSGADLKNVILDTKWKIPADGKPSDADLQQMHTYNVQLGASRSFILYPKISDEQDVIGIFQKGEALKTSFHHQCGMFFVDLFDGNKLRRDLGLELIAKITKHELISLRGR
ncbi:MAG: restriction endonuclease [Pseudomonadota bacterium]|nr:restriction endonuclease [Pseudomonadota bacterium]